MPESLSREEIEALWRNYLTTGDTRLDVPYLFKASTLHRMFSHLPAEPRCRLCFAPFKGLGGQVVRILWDRGPSRMNPHICNACEKFAEYYSGGAEVELTVLFADVRGSTTLAEDMTPRDFGELISRFYSATTRVMFDSGAMVEKLIGDEVTGLFTPGLAGQQHAAVALQAARDILAATGNSNSAKPWVPVGIGLHTGPTFVGSVGSEGGAREIAALGDAMNVGARLASLAAAGQVVLSAVTASAAGLDTSGLQSQRLQLKGRSEPVDAWVLTA